MKYLLLSLLLCIQFDVLAKKPIPPDLSKFAGKPVKEKLMAWVSYCDFFLGNQEGYEEDYIGLHTAAAQGLAMTPANEYWHLSTFNYFLGACTRNKDSARIYYQKAILFGQKGKHVDKVVTATSALLAEYGENIEASKPYQRILLEILDTIKDDRVRAEINYGLASYYANISWYETALDYEIKLLRFRKQQMDTATAEAGNSMKTNYGVSLNRIGNLYLNIDQSNKALDYYRESLQYFENYREAFEDSWKGMITCFGYLGLTDSANFYYQKLSRSVVDISHNWIMMAASQMAMTDAALNANKNELAEKHLTIAKVFVQKVNDSALTFQWLLLKGKADFSVAQSSATFTLLQQWQPYAKNGDITEYSDLLRLLAKGARLNNEFKSAADYYDEYTVLADSITKQKTSGNIAEKEARYQNIEKKRQLQESSIQLSDALKQQTILLAGIALLLASILLLFIIYRNKKRAAALIDTQNKNLTYLNMQLDEANKTKARLFSIISHDLRSPISQVYQFLKLQQLKPELLSSVQKQQLSDKIQAATGSLLETMEDLLLWSKSQVNAFKPSFESVDLNNALQQSLALLQLNIEGKNLIVKNYVHAAIIVNSDPHFLQTIFRNLLQNAVKAAPEKTTIFITASCELNKVCISISNEGNPFTQKDFEKIKLENSTDASLSGLGLRLIAELSEKLNVSIFFELQGNKTVANLSIPLV